MLYNIYRQTSKIFSQKFPRKVARIKYKFYLCSAFDKNTGLWCNGNITDSGPVIPGSNPGSPTKQTAHNAVCFFILPTPTKYLHTIQQAINNILPITNTLNIFE